MKAKIKVKKERRTVILGRFTPPKPGFGRGGAAKLWAFGIADLANAFGVSEGAIRKYMSQNLFDPADLRTILTFAIQRSGRATQERDVPGRARPVDEPTSG